MKSFADLVHRTRNLLPIIPAILILAAATVSDAEAAKPRKASPAATGAAVSITAPANGATVAGTVSITAQVGSGVSWINIYIDGSYLASSPPLTFSWDSTKVINGSHTISANAYNSSGTLAGSASINVVVQNANTKPAVTITAPANSATVSGTVSITTQTASGIGWINVYVDGSYFASSPPFSFSWDSTNVANGSHTISSNAYATNSTLAGSASVTINVQNGNPKPAVTLTSPTNGSTVSGNVTLTAQISSSVDWIDFEIDNSYFASSPPLSTIWDSTSVADGSHTVEAIAFNSSDQIIGTGTATVTVANHVSNGGGPIALRSTSTASASSATTGLTINAPAGVSPGDVLIAQIAVTGGSNAPVTGPSGWNLAAHNNSGTSFVQAVYYHVVPASPAERASYKWSWTGTSNNAVGGIADYENVNPQNPI
ncbi:MAG TPA: Ig-like domain-containing protein, partial [Candidatus Binataceae bacterium]|nr:Ig-like domain-containing protein [Candidatus Binataceae bacterium]